MHTTQTVYYDDPYLATLQAQVLATHKEEDGTWILTDRTIFYPGGGGQPADFGTINGVAVTAVRKEKDAIWHLAPGFPGTDVASVTLAIDFPHRLYMMQQHSGQHLLSHVLDQFGLKTESVHLGETYTSIEISGAYPDEERLQEIETEANALIRKHLKIHIHLADRETIKKFPLRKEAGKWSELRVVEIDQLDYSPCGGTHLKNTAEIGLILADHVERIRGRARLHFFIGSRAYERMKDLQQRNHELKEILNSAENLLTEDVKRLQEDLNTQRKQTTLCKKYFLLQEQQRLAGVNGAAYTRLDEIFAADITKFARTIAQKNQKPVFIVSGRRFCFALPDSISLNANDFIREYGQPLQLRGGGAPNFIQGGIQSADDSAIRQRLSEFLKPIAWEETHERN